MRQTAIPFEEAYALAKQAPIIMLESEARMLYDYALRSDTVIEVGSAFGGSATILIAAGANVHCIDPFLPSPEFVSRHYGRFGAAVPAKSLLECFRDQLERIQKAWQRSIFATTKNKDVDVKPFRHDMLFIDHTHTLADVAASIKHWRGTTKRYMAFHDYGDPKFKGVKNAVDGAKLKISKVVDCMAVVEMETAP